MEKFLIKRPKISCTTENTEFVQETSSLSAEDGEENDAEKNKNVKKNTYERKFRSKWADEFDFLVEKNGKTFCKVCNITIKGSGFHIKRHSTSNSHKNKYNAAKITPRVDVSLKSSKLTIYEQTKIMEKKIIAFLCDNNLPLSLVNEMTKFLQDLVPDNEILKHMKLQRDKATHILQQELGPFSKDLIFNKLRQEKFSLIIDETTDIGTKKCLVILARFFDKDVSRVKDHFVDLIEVVDSTAHSLFNCIKTMLELNNIPYENLIGFGADNASVMMGNINGVKVKLAEISPHIVVQGCGCHSLHLCASAACKKIPNCVEQFVRDLYTYFCHSSKKLNELREFQIFVEEKPTKLLYPSQTRWLSLKQVCSRILEHWASLTLFFQGAALEMGVANSTAKTIFHALQNPVFKLYLEFLEFNLKQITDVNQELQSETPKLPILLHRITTLYKSVLKCFIQSDIIKKTEIHEINVKNPHNYKQIENIYFGGKVDAFLKNKDACKSLRADDLNSFRVRCLDFYIELCLQLQKRFNFRDEVLQYASLFRPSVARSGDVLSIASYTYLFPNLKDVDVDVVNKEWQLLSETDLLSSCDDICDFWAKVSTIKNELGQLMFSNLMKIVQFVLSLPHSSAAAERVFSQLNLIKSKLRNRLLITTCSNILAVKENLKNGLKLPPKNYKVNTCA